MKKIKVLFICSQNSSRSQMAEAFLKNLDENQRFSVESAGIIKGVLHLPSILVMKEIGIDISMNKTKTINEVIKRTNRFDYIVCFSEKNKLDSPTPKLIARNKVHWILPNTTTFSSSMDKTIEFRELRDKIKENVLRFKSDILEKSPVLNYKI